MAKLLHQVVTVYKDDNGAMVGVCVCGGTYPLENSPQHGETTMLSHVTLSNRNEVADL